MPVNQPGRHHKAAPKNAAQHPAAAPKGAAALSQKALQSRLRQVDPATLTMFAHLLVVVTGLISGIFGFRLFYKLGLVAMIGLNGDAMFRAWKANGKKVGVELAKEPALPYLLLAALLFWFTRSPLMPLQFAFALQSALSLLKLASNSPTAMSHPAYKTQAKQLQDALRLAEPQFLSIASHFEILSVPWSVVKALSGSQSMLLPLFVLQFVRFLQLTQPRMQGAWKGWCDAGVKAAGWAEAQPGIPEPVRVVLRNTKAALSPKPE